MILSLNEYSQIKLTFRFGDCQERFYVKGLAFRISFYALDILYLVCVLIIAESPDVRFVAKSDSIFLLS